MLAPQDLLYQNGMSSFYSATHLGSAGFLLWQLLQLWPPLTKCVQHLLVANHLLEVPLVA